MRRALALFSLFILFSLVEVAPVLAQSAATQVIPPVKAGGANRSPCNRSLSNPGDTCAENAPNDIGSDDVDTCSRSYTISNTFDPDEVTTTTTDSQGNKITTTTYEEYDVEKVEQAVNLPPPKATYQDRRNTHQYANTYDLCASPEERRVALSNYTLQKGLNVSVRNIDFKLQECLKGQRMVKAALSLSKVSSLPNNTTNDKPIAYSNGGKCTSRSTSGTPIYLSQVVNTLRTKDRFFDPGTNCTKSSQLKSLSAILKLYADDPNYINDVYKELDKKGTIDHATAQLIYTNLELTDTGSIMQEFDVTNIAANDAEETKKVFYNDPLGAINNPQTGTVIDTRIGFKQKVDNRNICDTPTDNEIIDQKSPISFLGYVRNLLKEHITVFDKSVTVTKSLRTVQKIPKDVGIVDGKARTGMNNFLTIQQQKGLESVPVNATADKATTSTGNDNDQRFNRYVRLFYTLDQIKKYRL